jgi:hemerythrin
MPIIAWNDTYRTGIDIVDAQHRKLFDAINGLHDAMASGKGRAHVAETLSFLADYTMKHFADEERLMTTHGYPGYAEHKKIHDRLVAQVNALVAQLASGAAPTLEVSDFLSDWLKHHIDEVDRGYIPFFKSVGVAKDTKAGPAVAVAT